MSVVRWDPVREVAELQRSLSRLFDNLRVDEGSGHGFPVDIYETDDEVVVSADLPGVRPEDIQVHYHGGQLSIRYKRVLRMPQDAVCHRQERVEGEFVRTFSLATPINADAVRAEHEAGVLAVHLPKHAQAKPRQIPVQAKA